LQDSRDNGVARLYQMFSEKRWNVNGLKTLIKKLLALALANDYCR